MAGKKAGVGKYRLTPEDRIFTVVEKRGFGLAGLNISDRDE
jgi:hypothetical protein